VPDSPYARQCPACQRLVPKRIPTCRCGHEWPSRPGAPPGAAPAAVSGLWAIPITALIVLAGALLFSPQRASRPAPAVPSAAAASDLDTLAPPGAGDPPIEPPDRPAEPVARESALGDAAEPPVSPPSVADMVGRTSPAVVTIEAGSARGTGFFVGPDLVVTNLHVVLSAGQVTLRAGGTRANGIVVRRSPQTDLAVIRADRADPERRVLALRRLGDVRVGEEVLAIGSPGFGPDALDASVTRGIVSGIRRLGGVLMIQTDAALNPGNSGGPLLDRSGRVVGVATVKARGTESIGFAVAADHVVDLLGGTPPADPSSAGWLSHPDAPGLDGGSPARPDAASARDAGERQFDATASALGGHAATFARLVEQFRDACLGAQRAGGGTREMPWHVAEAYVAVQGVAHPDCVDLERRVTRLKTEIRRTLTDAEEQARRAGVYPGTVRAIRQQHGLDWDGWDR
jgi:S1-C subfamily serine protease